MPVLLLAYGDPQAKDMLRRAIEARYATRPPVLESLRVDFAGRAPFKVGPVNTWVPLDLTAYFRFPDAMRLDFTVRPLRLPVQRGVEAFDGTTYRSRRGNKAPTVITDAAHITTLRRRLWATASMLLTPLSHPYVRVDPASDASFTATNTRFDDAATLTLRTDATVAEVRVTCADAEGRDLPYVMQLSEEQTEANDDLILPAKIRTFWDNRPDYEFQPVSAVSNPSISDAVFTLEDEVPPLAAQ